MNHSFSVTFTPISSTLLHFFFCFFVSKSFFSCGLILCFAATISLKYHLSCINHWPIMAPIRSAIFHRGRVEVLEARLNHQSCLLLRMKRRPWEWKRKRLLKWIIQYFLHSKYIYIYTHTHTHTHIYIYCVCVCVCVYRIWKKYKQTWYLIDKAVLGKWVGFLWSMWPMLTKDNDN